MDWIARSLALVAIPTAVIALLIAGWSYSGVPFKQQFTDDGIPVAITHCDWESKFFTTLETLGENPIRWTSWDDPSGGWADMDKDIANVNPNTECELVGDTIRHEYAHLLQGRRWGGTAGVYKHYGTIIRTEVVADCVSKLLGSKDLPYVDKSDGYDVFVRPCSLSDLAQARLLLRSRS